MLRIIISPAKKMNLLEECPVEATRPRLLEKTEAIKAWLQARDYDTLKGIWNCNDRIAGQNWERLRGMELQDHVTPAVFAYEGIQYQSMAPMVFEQDALDYIGEHLYILSGFYGILGAFDGVVPYRLEMQAKLAWERADGRERSLYEYWGADLYEILTQPSGRDRAADANGQDVTIVNLASKEYSRAIEPWLSPEVRFVTCVFGELDRALDEAELAPPPVKVKATAAKMARGAMVRFMAEQQVSDIEQLKSFDRMGYRYLDARSDENTLVFGVPGKRR